MVMLIWLWPRISISTRGATPAAVSRVAQPCRASWRRMVRRPTEAVSRENERFRGHAVRAGARAPAPMGFLVGLSAAALAVHLARFRT